MWYVIYAEDIEDSLALRMEARPAHLERISALVDEGRILVAGPTPAIDSEDPAEAGFSGSLIVAQFESLLDAKVWADADPYVTAGVFKSVTVKPFKKVLP
nr:YciI family protein [uncultured Glaciecola sp.]